MRSPERSSLWWAIALTDALSIPAALLLGWFGLIAQNNCDTTCNGFATALDGTAVAIIALSICSAVAISVRSARVACLSWSATLVGWVVVAILLAPH